MRRLAVTAVLLCSLAVASGPAAPAYPGYAPGPDLHLRAADGTRIVGHEGATRMFVVDASLGANAAIVAATNIRPLVTGVVSLSAPATFRLDAVAAAKHLQVPVLYVAAEVDEGGIYAADAKTMFEATPVTDKSVVIVPGAAHGVALVAGPGRVRTLLEGFIRAHGTS